MNKPFENIIHPLTEGSAGGDISVTPGNYKVVRVFKCERNVRLCTGNYTEGSNLGHANYADLTMEQARALGYLLARVIADIEKVTEDE